MSLDGVLDGVQNGDPTRLRVQLLVAIIHGHRHQRIIPVWNARPAAAAPRTCQNRSASRLTGSPGCRPPRLVASQGVRNHRHPEAVVVEAGHGQADAVDGDRALLDHVAQHRVRRRSNSMSTASCSGSADAIVPTPSTWPCTQVAAERSPARSAGSRLTAAPGRSRPSVERSQRLGHRVERAARRRRSPSRSGSSRRPQPSRRSRRRPRPAAASAAPAHGAGLRPPSPAPSRSP